MRAEVWLAFNNATHADVESITLFTDHNGDTWVVNQGNAEAYRVAQVVGWDGASW